MASSTSDPPRSASARSTRELASIVLVSWLATLGVDLFLNAGVFAGVFFAESPFLLEPLELFVRIPLGYLSFLLQTVLLVWLMARLGIVGWRAAGRFGLVVGVLVHGAAVLGMASVSTARPSFLVAWFVGQSVQLGVVGAIAGHGFATDDRRQLLAAVVAMDVALVAVTIALQSLNIVPTPV